jgi:coenzyme F420 hydrogenase subunit beta
MWEGYAADEALRYKGSSGGLASALALFCVERNGMAGVVHIGSNPKKPWLNETRLSSSYEELNSNTGSRYSPASPCDGFHLAEESDSPCAFIGKPCDVEGLRKAQKLRPELREKIPCAIGIFCAGTPSTKATLDLLKKHHADLDRLEAFRYRGNGWPGMSSMSYEGEPSARDLLSYEESWGFLQSYRPLRCHLCPDGTSEFADVACGDPWYRPIEDDEPGRSLVIVRTETGRRLVRDAMAAGYVHLEEAPWDRLPRSQDNLFGKRSSIWGRSLALRAVGARAPRFRGFYLFRNWLRLPLGRKLRSLMGTLRRGLQRRYFRPRDLGCNEAAGSRGTDETTAQT